MSDLLAAVSAHVHIAMTDALGVLGPMSMGFLVVLMLVVVVFLALVTYSSVVSDAGRSRQAYRGAKLISDTLRAFFRKGGIE